MDNFFAFGFGISTLSEKGLELEVIDWFLIKSSRKLLVTGIFKGLRRFQQKNFCNHQDNLLSKEL